jgi:hypothetical protein
VSGGTPRTSPDQAKHLEALLLVEMFRADQDVVRVETFPYMTIAVVRGTESAEPACRCYRCGVLLTVELVKVDRQRSFGTADFVRPACDRCWAG